MAAPMAQTGSVHTSSKNADKKTKTCKSRRETAVQGTNDSSIVSKCSMAAVGYFSDPYLHCFVSKTTRRSPLIHRGYYIRAKAVDFFLKKFLTSYPEKNQIVSLGAGFDSTYFRLRSEGVLSSTLFYEIDFPDVVQRKNSLIQNNKDLQKLIPGLQSQGEKGNPLIEINTEDYKLLGVDLTQLNTLEACLNLCGVDWDTPTLLLSECVMTYMTRRCSSAVVKWAGEAFSEAVFILYEQINPNDAFGKFMQKHFQLIGSPLKCINAFPTLWDQRDRFLKLGWSRSEAADMNYFYRELVPPDEHHRVESLEPFDEYEEWHLKCSHYMVVVASNASGFPSVLSDIGTPPETDSPGCLPVEWRAGCDLVKRFGHSSVMLRDVHSLVSFGGFGEEAGKHCRILDLTVTDIRTLQSYVVPVKVNPREVQVSRMHDQSILLRDGSVLLVGGRTSPIHMCTQVLKVEFFTKDPPSSALICTRCGFMAEDVCQHRENSSPQEDVCQHRENSSPQEQVFVEVSSVNSESDSFTNILCPSNSEIQGEHNTEISGDQRPSSRPHSVNSVNHRPSEISENRLMNSNNKCADNGACDRCACGGGLGEGAVRGDGGQGGQYSGVRFQEMKTSGDSPSPRWRHAAVLIHYEGRDLLYLHGGRTDKELALDDSYLLDTETFTWTKIEDKGPGRRQSHTASVWGDHVIIAGGMDQGLRPLDSVFMFSVHTRQHTLLQVHESLLPRYSHTAHVIDNQLILVGGVNVNHSVPGVAVIDIDSKKVREFSIPVEYGEQLLMLHKHTSCYLGNNRILVIGGGGNCFSFGTHLNCSPFEIDISQCFGEK
uniref:tRNA wybutosine-synthesizing protein 4 n=2 Tax=Magallana gigas TaxID=29159 RepID=A0A8W8JP88_MAGGI|nr:tRNA wybutosine-synthesizing protein 4 [Crassostrea gigas]